MSFYNRYSWQSKYPTPITCNDQNKVKIKVNNTLTRSTLSCFVTHLPGNCHTLYAYQFNPVYFMKDKERWKNLFLEIIKFAHLEKTSEICFSFNGTPFYKIAKQVAKDMGFKVHRPKWNERYTRVNYKGDPEHIITKVTGNRKILFAKHFPEGI